MNFYQNKFLFSALALAVSSNAYSEGLVLEEIIVTAQKRSESIQDVPIAITALSGGELADAGIAKSDNLPRLTPNFVFNSTNSSAQPYIRGIGTEFSNAGLELSTGVYYDDVYVSAPIGGIFQFFDIERVEVLKGPQGTLYGRNSTAGALRIVSKNPNEDTEARVSIWGGDLDAFGIDAMISGQLSNGLYGRLAVFKSERDGHVTNVFNGDELGSEDLTAARFTLLAEPSENLTLNLKVEFSDKEDSAGQIFHLDDGSPAAEGLGFFQAVQSSLPEYDIGYESFAFRADYDFENMTLSSITGYRHTESDTFLDLDFTGDLTAGHFDFFDRRNAWQQELQLVSTDEEALSWVTGLYAYFEESENTFTDAAQVAFTTFNEVEVFTYAAYAELTYEFSDELSLVVGGRYSVEDKDYLGGVLTAGGVPTPIPGNDATFKRFTPKATVTYRWTPDVLTYFTYSQGFKSGGFSTPVTGIEAPNRIDEEVLDNFEVGIKAEFGAVRWNTSAFYYLYGDIQVINRNAVSNLTTTENAAEATVFGLETDVSVALTQEWTVMAGMGYLNAEYDNYENAGAVVALPGGGFGSVPGLDLSGNDLPRSPEVTGFVGANYKRELDAAGILTANHNSGFNFDPAGVREQESYTVLSGSVGWSNAGEQVSVALSGDNLTDEEYFVTRSVGASLFSAPALPRTWKVAVTYNY